MFFKFYERFVFNFRCPTCVFNGAIFVRLSSFSANTLNSYAIHQTVRCDGQKHAMK